ncbi:MAG: hypothetical protein COB36_06200 [Alphaproteobacteria bacterium]|nr:MAG: hypothetical protein COB36_06200 [Alphaproteobacteria bacterium]
MKKIYLLLVICSATLCVGLFSERTTASSTVSEPTELIAKAENKEPAEIKPKTTDKHPADIQNVQAGDYLSGKFAQNNHDWKNANQFINRLIEAGIAPDNILQRAMILSMGSGNAEKAIIIAKTIKENNTSKHNTITEIFILVDAIKHKEYKKAQALLNKMPDDSTVRFIGPFIDGWLSAAQNTMNIKSLKQSTMQLYHAILISDYLDDHSDIERMIDKALKVEDIREDERGRIADLYGHVGLKKKAIAIYRDILEHNPSNSRIKTQLQELEQGTNKPLFKNVNSAHHGIAKAFHDIASILNNEQNEESARVFAHISLYLEPNMMQTRILLAEINANHKQYARAISLYQSIPKSSKEYIQAQHDIVDIYEATQRFDDALTLLKRLPNAGKDVDTIIKIGNLYRNQEKYKLALESYNIAAKILGTTIPKEYWHLHYVRGIAYEQSGNWDRAEQELQSALTMQPDHPYILNYLGYAWADKGINLQQSLEMIQHAVNLLPSDGYITDSLGWVMYRTQNYKRAVPVLERAVELLPYDPTINDHLGDAYWKVGRLLEAKFQWKRAKNHSDDDIQIKELEIKLTSGIKK